MIDPGSIRPVGFDRDEIKPLLLDESARDALAHTIEFRGAVRCLAKENELRIADAAKEGSEIRCIDCSERRARSCDLRREIVFNHRALRNRPRE